MTLLTLIASIAAAVFGYIQNQRAVASRARLDIRFLQASNRTSITVENTGGRMATGINLQLAGAFAMYERGAGNRRIRMHSMQPGAVETRDIYVDETEMHLLVEWRDVERPSHVISEWYAPIEESDAHQELERQNRLSRRQTRKERRKHQWIVGPFLAPSGTATPRQAAKAMTSKKPKPKARGSNRREQSPAPGQEPAHNQ